MSKKSYVKPVISEKGNVSVVASMACSTQPNAKAHCLRA